MKQAAKGVYVVVPRDEEDALLLGGEHAAAPDSLALVRGNVAGSTLFGIAEEMRDAEPRGDSLNRGFRDVVSCIELLAPLLCQQLNLMPSALFGKAFLKAPDFFGPLGIFGGTQVLDPVVDADKEDMHGLLCWGYRELGR